MDEEEPLNPDHVYIGAGLGLHRANLLVAMAIAEQDEVLENIQQQGSLRDIVISVLERTEAMGIQLWFRRALPQPGWKEMDLEAKSSKVRQLLARRREQLRNFVFVGPDAPTTIATIRLEDCVAIRAPQYEVLQEPADMVRFVDGLVQELENEGFRFRSRLMQPHGHWVVAQPGFVWAQALQLLREQRWLVRLGPGAADRPETVGMMRFRDTVSERLAQFHALDQQAARIMFVVRLIEELKSTGFCFVKHQAGLHWVRADELLISQKVLHLLRH